MNTPKATRTERGFGIVKFKDAYGNDCSMQCSSAIGDYPDSFDHPGSSYLWLGLNEGDSKIMAADARKHGIQTSETTGWIPYPIPDDVLLSTRMHLNRDQVSTLIEYLQHWLKTGEL